MKETKKTTTKTDAKTEPTKQAMKAETEKAESPAKAATVKKAAEKKTTVTRKTAAKKAVVEQTITVQFDGKSYTSEDLVKIAKDVWKYDLNMDEEEFKSVELFVKPEESTVYYVVNGDVKGNFRI